MCANAPSPRFGLSRHAVGNLFMSVLINGLLPIFALILLGTALKQARFVPEESWPGMERIAYYIFFPALMIETLYKADFGELAATQTAIALFLGIAFLLALMLIVRPPLQRALGIDSPAYSSLYQATTRWNTFIILAIAGEIAGAKGLTVVAIAVGAMVVPINVVNIPVVAMLGHWEGERPNPMRHIVRNPLILGTIAGLLLNFSGLKLPMPAETVLGMLGRISLPLGLLLVGAGLKFRMPREAIATIAAGSVIKLLLMPLVLGASAYLFGVRGEELVIVALCGAGPAAMNGYLVAREMGGDAPLVAGLITVQTFLAMATIPIVIAIAQWVS